MKRCETCKHWEQNEGNYLPQFGTCHGIGMRDYATVWDEEIGTRVIAKGYEHVKAFVKDGSDYYAVLLPAKDFGCVMYEEGKYLSDTGED